MTTTREALVGFASRDLAAGTRPDDVVEMLVRNGMEEAEARVLVQDLGGGLRAERAAAGMGGLALGVVLVAIGLGITAISLASGGGGGRVYAGLVLTGLVVAGRGLYRWFG